MYYRGGQGSCADPMSKDNGAHPVQTNQEAKIQPRTGGQNCLCISGLLSTLRKVRTLPPDHMYPCGNLEMDRAWKWTEAGMLSWELFSLFQAVGWKLDIYPQQGSEATVAPVSRTEPVSQGNSEGGCGAPAVCHVDRLYSRHFPIRRCCRL